MGTNGVKICENEDNGEAMLRELADDTQWLNDSIHVYDGTFTVDADKGKLVDTVLGLYSKVLMERRSGGLLRKMIDDDKDSVSLAGSRLSSLSHYSASNVYCKPHCTKLALAAITIDVLGACRSFLSHSSVT